MNSARRPTVSGLIDDAARIIPTGAMSKVNFGHCPNRKEATMRFKIQVITVSDDGVEESREVASLERQELGPETFGLTLAESKTFSGTFKKLSLNGKRPTFLPLSGVVRIAINYDPSKDTKAFRCKRSLERSR